MNQTMSETHNAYRWAFIRICLRHDWSMEDLHVILGYMIKYRHEWNCLFDHRRLKEAEAHRQALIQAQRELIEMMNAHALSVAERNVIMKLVEWNNR